MSLARRFLTGFRETETNAPGLELNEDGTVDLVNPDGSRTALPGGGSSAPVNWARIGLAPKVLTVASPNATYGVGDLSIISQTGADFSVDAATIVSAAGGRFQFAAFVPNPAAGLDGGDTRQRWLIFGATQGVNSFNGGPPINDLGLDITVPIVEGGGTIFSMAQCGASAIAYVDPGGPALQAVFAKLANGFGTDSIDLEFLIFEMYIWQV